jgi:ribosomal protein S18 acetylase RimI-like enzyme
MTISFRAITGDDQEFLYRVYASTRADEMALVDWSAEEKEQFLRFQFRAQHTEYHKNYADAQFQLILRNEAPIGRLYLHWRDRELRIIDIALLPEHRGAGIGGRIMQDLLQQAESVGKSVSIHVEQNNPALRLYQRLGFQKVRDVGLYYLMERRQPDAR